MGTRVFTDNQRLTYKTEESRVLPGIGLRNSGGGLLKQQISGNYKLQVIYDGTSGKHGLPAALEATEAWADASSLYRAGLDTGPRFQNIGDCAVDIYGCMYPRELAYNPTAADVTKLSGVWTKLNGESAMVKGDMIQPDGVFSLLRFVFTAAGSSPGCVVALTL